MKKDQKTEEEGGRGREVGRVEKNEKEKKEEKKGGREERIDL